ncbi:ABC transporter substrate-binding protein [Primorskyibacter flagellatus]|uniref:Iron(III) transport system substrate-binding protein n=1 Tax=Primorskyibacter flagellatus TaxID=1387277 RepID=A0A1W2EHC4_9RHOB|nr:ABC transporter substrate-binding protein [Primorskyibacter flagellatus]SMD09089.1 iron(III) transport system substrate-binding protein [Primorskyibacter flagellatus]
MKNVNKPAMRSAALALGAALVVPMLAQAEEAGLDALIEAAKAEPQLTVYDSTGKIVTVVENFAEKYGLDAIGQKVSATAQLEMVIRESQADNVKGDVLMITDAPAALAQLIPQGFVHSYLPPDMADVIPTIYQDPMTATTNANVFAYNTEVHDSCPVSNIWELTDEEWTRKFAMIDPLTKASYTDWFSQMESHHDDAVRDAYEAHYGKPLVTEFDSATKRWVADLGANAPLVTDGDDNTSAAVGAPGQETPFFGLMSSAKFRDVEAKGHKMAICDTLEPWVGWTYSKLALIASGTDSPNAAKLFVHFILTEEGIGPQMVDGKVPTNSTISMPANEPSGIIDLWDNLLAYDSATGLADWDSRQDWQDFWRIHYSR